MKSYKGWLVTSLLLLVSFTLLVGTASAEEPLVNLLLFETSIREALSEISMQTGVNIIPDQTVNGVVTADLQDVPLERALRMILIGGGFTYRLVDDFYFVGLPDPRSTTFGELVETELISLQNITASQALAALPAFLAPYVNGEQSGSLLTVTAPPTELARIKNFLTQLDQPQKQIEVKVVITEVSSDAVKEIGVNLWEYTATAGQQKNENWEAFFGFDAGLISFGTNVYGTLLTNLRLMEEQQKAVIHADPKVVVSSGEQAQLFIGDRQILLIDGEQSTATRIERLEVGLTLAVTPTIVGTDQIVLEITPEMSHFVNEAKPDLIVKESALSTTIRLASGQTALLAGMTLQQTVDYSKKVPILGDIPFLRWLFRNDVQREGDKELMIFVTPVIK